MIKKILATTVAVLAGAATAIITADASTDIIVEVDDYIGKSKERITRKEKVPGKLRKQYVTRNGFGEIVNGGEQK